MESVLNSFGDYLTVNKKVSTNTLEAYLRDIRQFILYCTSNKILDFNYINADFVIQYIESQRAKGKSDATLTRIVASLRCFFSFLYNGGNIFSNPTEKIQLKRTEKKIPGILEEKEIFLLLNQPDGSDYKSIRDKAILELLYATGIKVSEIIDIDVDDINLQLNILHLKNNKHERIIPIYPEAAKHIDEYINIVRPVIVQNNSENKLFTNMNGHSLSRQGLWKIIKQYAEKAGIKKDITPHTLRHSLAAHLLENGAQLKDIQEMLGHSDISSTQVYAQIIKNKYIQSYAKFHPLANR